MHTGTLAQDQIQYPALGSLIANELNDRDAVLPGFVSVAPEPRRQPRPPTAPASSGRTSPRWSSATAARPRCSPARAAERSLRVQNLEPPRDVPAHHLDARVGLLEDMEADFVARPARRGRLSHQAAYDRAVRLMHSDAGRAFDLDEEKDALRDAYGRNLFGQGCLLARRLVERGVPFIEVALGGLNGGGLGWDTHTNNFDTVKSLSQVLDAAWSSLMGDLKAARAARHDADRLDGRVRPHAADQPAAGPRPLPQRLEHRPGRRRHQGRPGRRQDRQERRRGGGAAGRRADFLATVCLALGVDPMKQNKSNVGRPIRIVDKSANPIKEVLA